MTRLFAAALSALVLAATLLPGPARAAVAIQEVTSPGGLTAWLVEDHSIPFTALEIRFRGGGSLDLPEKRGATNLMVALIEEGAADLSAQDFAAARERLAASYSFDTYDDAVSVSARFLTENRDDAVELLRKALVEPRFDQDAVDRVRGQVLSNIRSDATDPNAMASRAFDALAYAGDPYATSLDGTIESITALTRDDVVEAHRRTLARDRIYVGAVGDITPEALGALLDTLLGALPETGAPFPERHESPLTPGVTVVPFETPQSVAVFGHTGIRRDDPDFFPAYIANEIFGGAGLTSRLMDEVREKRGLTYGVSSYLVSLDRAEMVLGQVASANDRMAEAIDVVRQEWARIGSEGVTEEELAEAKTYLTGAYALRFDGNAPIARIIVGMQLDNLPIDYNVTRNDKINAVTLDDIRRVAKRIYRPEDLRFVVVGQPAGLQSTD